MAIKSKTDLLADIAALTPLIDDSDIMGILTDMVESMGTGMRSYTDPNTPYSMRGDTTMAHGLGITVRKVFVTETIATGQRVHEPSFTLTDDDNLIIHWVGADLTADSVEYQAY